jgi:hypothetical protein
LAELSTHSQPSRSLIRLIASSTRLIVPGM